MSSNTEDESDVSDGKPRSEDRQHISEPDRVSTSEAAAGGTLASQSKATISANTDDENCDRDGKSRSEDFRLIPEDRQQTEAVSQSLRCADTDTSDRASASDGAEGGMATFTQDQWSEGEVPVKSVGGQVTKEREKSHANFTGGTILYERATREHDRIGTHLQILGENSQTVTATNKPTVVNVQGPQILERVVFGGDVLTNERAFTAQESRQNTSSDMDGFKGIIHRPEGLHRQMNFLLSIYQTFYYEKTSGDSGTLYNLRNMLNRRNVSGPKEVTVNFRSHFQFVQDVMEGCVVAQFKKLHALSSSLPVFSLLDQQQQRDWLLQQANEVMENLQISDTTDVDSLREELAVLDTDDHTMSSMHDGTEYHCPMCNKAYTKHSWFKKHLVSIHKWKFHEKSAFRTSTNNPVSSFLRMALLLHDTCDAYRMCDGPRIMLNAKLEWLYAASMHHTKYKLWLWRMLAYDIALLTEREAFEYKWNSALNLAGGVGKNIPNDNCVEINVHKIKSQLMTQGPNKSFDSAHTIAMTTQVVDSLKDSVMKASKTIRHSRQRPTVDKSKDVETVAKCFMEMSDIAKSQWKSFPNFKDPFSKLNVNELHDWVNEQKLLCSKLKL